MRNFTYCLPWKFFFERLPFLFFTLNLHFNCWLVLVSYDVITSTSLFKFPIIFSIHRGYYMAVLRYEIYLRVLKNISRVSAAKEWNILFQHEKRNYVSPSDHVMFYLLYKHQWNAKPFYLNSFFGVKGAVYYEAIATVIFSHVKITCYFHFWRYVKAHLVFHWCLYNK